MRNLVKKPLFWLVFTGFFAIVAFLGWRMVEKHRAEVQLRSMLSEIHSQDDAIRLSICLEAADHKAEAEWNRDCFLAGAPLNCDLFKKDANQNHLAHYRQREACYKQFPIK